MLLPAVPIIVAIIMGLLMMCLGNPRQMLGMPLSEGNQSLHPQAPEAIGDNPVFNHKFSPEGQHPCFN